MLCNYTLEKRLQVCLICFCRLLPWLMLYQAVVIFSCKFRLWFLIHQLSCSLSQNNSLSRTPTPMTRMSLTRTRVTGLSSCGTPPAPSGRTSPSSSSTGTWWPLRWWRSVPGSTLSVRRGWLKRMQTTSQGKIFYTISFFLF